MSFTNMLLGGGWGLGEWPDHIEVVHDACRRESRTYVPSGRMEQLIADNLALIDRNRGVMPADAARECTVKHGISERIMEAIA